MGDRAMTGKEEMDERTAILEGRAVLFCVVVKATDTAQMPGAEVPDGSPRADSEAPETEEVDDLQAS
jgi:hypothetical protein